MQVVTIRVTEDMHKKLKSKAKKQGLTMNAFIVNELWKVLKAERNRHYDSKTNTAALSEIVQGKEIPGWKAVEGRSNRVITDPDAAYKELIKAGYKKAVLFNQVPIPLTEAEKLITKEDYEEILKKYIEKPKGKTTLAPGGDKRPAMQVKTTVEEAFGGENEYKEGKEV